MASMFKVGTGSCAGRSVSPSFPGCGDILVFFLLLLSYIQMIYIIIIMKPHQFYIYNNSANFVIEQFSLYSNRLLHRHDYIKIFYIAFQCTVNF